MPSSSGGNPAHLCRVVHRFAGVATQRPPIGDARRMGGPAAARPVDVSGLPALEMLPSSARRVVRRHDGVATTALLVSAGVSDTVVSRRVRQGHWRRLHRGVVLLQSGPPSWRQLAQGAVLAAGPGAALSHRSAGFAHGLVATPAPEMVVSVPLERTPGRRPGLVVRRRRSMPPAAGALRCVDVADTVLDLVADARREDEVVGLLCDAARSGVPRPLLLSTLARRPVLRHRRMVADLLGDADARVESPLELRFDRDVEYAHGLPRSSAQVRERVGAGWVRADRRYRELGVRVELDGRLAHDGRADADAWRDNVVRVESGDITLRYRWRHVVTSPCAIASQLAAALSRRGWRGAPRRCGVTCGL